MKKFAKDVLTDFALMSVLFILLGVLFLVFPETSGKMVCYILAGVLCILGVIRIVNYFLAEVASESYQPDFTVGIVLFGFGIFIFAKPQVILSILPIAVGISVLLDSLLKLQSAIDMLRMKSSGWWVMLILTLITAVLGVIMLVNPFATAAVFLQFIGISLIVTGLLDIWSLGSLRTQIKRIRRAVEDAAAVETSFNDLDK